MHIDIQTVCMCACVHKRIKKLKDFYFIILFSIIKNAKYEKLHIEIIPLISSQPQFQKCNIELLINLL